MDQYYILSSQRSKIFKYIIYSLFHRCLGWRSTDSLDFIGIFTTRFHRRGMRRNCQDFWEPLMWGGFGLIFEVMIDVLACLESHDRTLAPY